MAASTTDWVADPWYEYGHQWWLDMVDGYAFMEGRFGQVAIVAPEQDMVIVFTARLPDTVGAVGVARWLAETYLLSANVPTLSSPAGQVPVGSDHSEKVRTSA